MSRIQFLTSVVFLLSFSQYAHAIFGIPGTPSIPIVDPFDAARELERQQRCTHDRDDASKHQRIIEAAQAEAQSALNQNIDLLSTEQSDLEGLTEESKILEQEKQLIDDLLLFAQTMGIQNGSQDVAVQSIYKEMQDPDVHKVIEVMSQNDDLQIQQFAKYIKTLFDKTEQDLNEYIKSGSKNEFSKSLLESSIQLQAVVSRAIGYNVEHVKNSKENVTKLSTSVEQYKQKISAYKQDWANQEERKKCNY